MTTQYPRQLPLGVQFNNPLNVRPSPSEVQAGRSNWQGAIAIEHTPSGPFLHFDAPPKGWRCAAGNVIAHYDRWQHDTIAKLIGGTPGRPGWAPPSDNNDSAGYVARVVHMTGFDADQVLDFHSYVHLKPVLVAMATVEQGASPYIWWNEVQIDYGMEQYGVIKPKTALQKLGPAIGASTATTVATTTAITPMPTPSYPPVLPDIAVQSVPIAPMPGIDPAPVLEHAQTLLQQIAPYVKWAGIALLVAIAAGFAWRWWRDRQKCKPGPDLQPGPDRVPGPDLRPGAI